MQSGTTFPSWIKRLRVCTIVAAIAVIHCNSALGQDVGIKIIEGTTVSERQFPYVARLQYAGDLLCTGTLITKRHVLTAAHCFFDGSGNQVVRNTSLVVRLNGQQVTSSKVTIHPAYVARGSACVDGETDAAIVQLSKEVTGVTPIPLFPSRAPVGATLTLVGYGTEGSGASGEGSSIPAVGLVNYGTTKLQGYGDIPPEQDTGSSYYYWKFDSGESNTASGDSGGPAFYDVNGKRYISGITCGGEGRAEYGTYSFNTRADILVRWAASVTGGSTPAPGVKPTPSPADPEKPVSGPRLAVTDAVLQFDGDDSDYLEVEGKLFVGRNFKPKGKKLTVSIGAAYSKTFKLSGAGEGSSGDSYVELQGARARGKYKKSKVGFLVSLGGIDFDSVLSEYGFTDSWTAEDGDEATLPISIVINGRKLQRTLAFVFNAESEQWELQ